MTPRERPPAGGVLWGPFTAPERQRRMENTLKGTLTRARDDAEEAARYLAHTRNELAILLEQAAGHEHTRAKIKQLLAHVIAAGIKAEQVTGHTQTAAEWLGDTIEPARLYFAGDIAKAREVVA